MFNTRICMKMNSLWTKKNEQPLMFVGFERAGTSFGLRRCMLRCFSTFSFFFCCYFKLSCKFKVSRLCPRKSLFVCNSRKIKGEGRGCSYLEFHHWVLAELVSAGGGDLVQADEFGLVADAIALKTPDESCLAAILPCRHKPHTHLSQQCGFQSRTSIYLGPAL